MEFITSLLPPEWQEGINGSWPMLILFIVLFLVIILLYIGLTAFVLWALLKINKKFFSRLEKKHGQQLSYQFMESVIAVVIIILVVVIPLAGDKIQQSLLSSTAVIAAVAGIAAQDVLKDMFSGLMISIYKPFNIGDRIELDDGTVGVVENITMRHVVLIKIDTLRLVIPNSKLNNVTVLNYSFGDNPRGILLKYPVDYSTDIQKAKKVIYEAVRSSPLSVPGLLEKDSTEPIYAPVYFYDVGANALIMTVTAYCQPGNRTEVVKDDINTRVYAALKENGIEIPYNYLNIITKSGE